MNTDTTHTQAPVNGGLGVCLPEPLPGTAPSLFPYGEEKRRG